ncbi:expressed unknown protein [Seminavis robusta]|uniref:Uncharacterized protein n=1 Tax=Seminavis robusta TaxID=568900 RepID=A0A9N8HQ02_9STRA|nr:expressed unknown protein [Seminavis robusta]|eukprot:Sro1144_g246120.1 n/a (561) ;mRNA; r:27031-28797
MEETPGSEGEHENTEQVAMFDDVPETPANLEPDDSLKDDLSLGAPGAPTRLDEEAGSVAASLQAPLVSATLPDWNPYPSQTGITAAAAAAETTINESEPPSPDTSSVVGDDESAVPETMADVTSEKLPVDEALPQELTKDNEPISQDGTDIDSTAEQNEAVELGLESDMQNLLESAVDVESETEPQELQSGPSVRPIDTADEDTETESQYRSLDNSILDVSWELEADVGTRGDTLPVESGFATDELAAAEEEEASILPQHEAGASIFGRVLAEEEVFSQSTVLDVAEESEAFVDAALLQEESLDPRIEKATEEQTDAQQYQGGMFTGGSGNHESTEQLEYQGSDGASEPPEAAEAMSQGLFLEDLPESEASSKKPRVRRQSSEPPEKARQAFIQPLQSDVGSPGRVSVAFMNDPLSTARPGSPYEETLAKAEALARESVRQGQIERESSHPGYYSQPATEAESQPFNEELQDEPSADNWNAETSSNMESDGILYDQSGPAQDHDSKTGRVVIEEPPEQHIQPAQEPKPPVFGVLPDQPLGSQPPQQRPPPQRYARWGGNK